MLQAAALLVRSHQTNLHILSCVKHRILTRILRRPRFPVFRVLTVMKYLRCREYSSKGISHCECDVLLVEMDPAFATQAELATVLEIGAMCAVQ